MFGGFLWLNANLAQVASLLERQVQIRIFPAEGTPATTLAPLIESLSGIRSVEILAGESAYERLAPVFGRETLMNALPADAFSDSLSAELQDPDQADETVSQIRTLEGVGDVVWGQGFAQILYKISNAYKGAA